MMQCGRSEQSTLPMRSRTCKKCFANIGYYPEWVNGSPYCHPHAADKKAEIEESRNHEPDNPHGVWCCMYHMIQFRTD